MKNKKILYMFLCGFGGGLIGYFANKLSNPFGIIMFTLGIMLLVFSSIKISKIKE